MDTRTEVGRFSDKLIIQRHLVMIRTQPDLDKIWDQIELILLETKSTWNDYFTLQYFYERIANGTFQLFIMVDQEEEIILATIAQMVQYPNTATMNFLWMGGKEAKRGIEYLPDLEIMLKKLGIKKIVFTGRKGFLRLLKRHGYEQRAIAFEKDLTHLMEH